MSQDIYLDLTGLISSRSFLCGWRKYITKVFKYHKVKLTIIVRPNMITLIGLCTVIVNVLTLFYYAPDLGECPRWVYSS
jgi:ethanolaminephosphotransferase